MLQSPARFDRYDDGSVSAIAALCMVVLALLAAVSLESAHLYLVKLRCQRVADLAVLAAANTSSPIVNGTVSAKASDTAGNVAAINGIDQTLVETSVVDSPQKNGGQALSATIREDVPLIFSGLLGRSTIPVAATAIVDVDSATPGPCTTSLRTAGATNVMLGADVQGADCLVSARGFLYVDVFSKISVKRILVGIPSSQEAIWVSSARPDGISPSPSNFVYDAPIADPLDGSTAINAMASHLRTMTAWPYGSSAPIHTPSISGGTATTYTNEAHIWVSSGVHDPRCRLPFLIGDLSLKGTNTITVSSGCYIVNGSMTQSGGSTTFVTARGAKATFVVTGQISNSGGSLKFGDATILVTGLVNNNNGNVSFGKGTKQFIGGLYNAYGTMSVGNGPTYFWNGVVNNTITGQMTLGNGPFYFYLGGLINDGKGTFGNGPYYFNVGAITTGPSSTTAFGTGTMDLFGTSMSLYGDVTFGSGGSATEGSAMISLYGGTITLWNGNLTALGVTIAAASGSVLLYGTGAVRLTAPKSATPTFGYQNILIYVAGTLTNGGAPTSGTEGGLVNADLMGGNTNTMSGIIYVPQSWADLQGSQTVMPPTDGCLQVVAGIVSFAFSVQAHLAPCMRGSTQLNSIAIAQ